MAQTNAMRIALTPFAAPADNPMLMHAAVALPDMLTAALSEDGHFQLVERDKIDGLWNEMHLTEAGLVSADTVAKFGQVLACDWLVSGSLVQTETGPQMWLKLIDTQSGVVLDLQSFPFSPVNFSASAKAAADFLVQARVRGHPREFIALDKFEDRTAGNVTLEDWTPRLKALIEEHFLSAGYGVVERQTVAPIFSEYQLQSAGMTADENKRVKLKPAFWIVSGHWEWVIGPQNQISIALQINKAGGGPQLLSIVKPPGEELEKAVVETIQQALKDTGSVTEPQALAAEQKYHDEHIDTMVKGRDGPYLPSRFDTNVTYITVTNPVDGHVEQRVLDRGYEAAREKHAEETLKQLQQAILLNPKDMKAKYNLGMSFFGSTDAVKNRQGEDLLNEVAASGEPTLSTKAKNWLADVHSGKITFEYQFGFQIVVPHGNPASFAPPEESQPRMDNAPVSRKIAARAAPQVGLAGKLTGLAEYKDVTAITLFQHDVQIACGNKLHTYNLDEKTSQDTDVPELAKKTVVAIDADSENLWLGTDSGVVHYSIADQTVPEPGENDQSPTNGITAMHRIGSRVFVAFQGGFGFFETNTENIFFRDSGTSYGGSDTSQPIQNRPTNDIDMIDGVVHSRDLWVSSAIGFQHHDLGLNSWSRGIPMELVPEIGRLRAGDMDVSQKYLVLKDSMHCVAVHPFPGTSWFTVNLDGASAGPQSDTLALDPSHPDWLWVGGDGGSITLIDLSSVKILAEDKLGVPDGFTVNRILPVSDKVVFLAGNPATGESSLFDLDKTSLFGDPPMVIKAKSNSDAAVAIIKGPPPSPTGDLPYTRDTFSVEEMSGRLERHEEKFMEATNVAVKAEHQFHSRENPYVVGDGMVGRATAYCFGEAAYGTGAYVALDRTLTLSDFAIDGQGGQELKLPVNIDYPITALTLDESNLWIGTFGGDIIRIPRSGGPPQMIDVKNQLPMYWINTLASIRGRLFVGFGDDKYGAVGYLDKTTLQFTTAVATGSPRLPVWQIASSDDQTLWVVSRGALYSTDYDLKQWTKELPSKDQVLKPHVGSQSLAVNKDFVVVSIASGGMAIRRLSQAGWTHVNFSTNDIENCVISATLDDADHLWMGGWGKITIMDLNTDQILLERRLGIPGPVDGMFWSPDVCFFLQNGIRFDSVNYEVNRWLTPQP
ncbi:MAG TPA: CsgG/HfaB family protein [Candidatus Sulfotelmatobacter sp.]|nr:CsgG/HfaB family protein [Candidatus Sulfotelmatobacter sp.]